MNKLLSIVLLFSSFSALAISPEAVLHGVCDRDRALYARGEEMSFTIALEGCGADYTGEGHFVSWKRTGDDGKTDSGKIPAAELLAKPFVYKTSLDRPGFVWFYSILQNGKGQRVEATLENARKRSFEFSGSAGVEIETLESVPEPDDFDAFWAKRRARLAKTPMTAKLTEGECETEGMKAYVVEVACAGPRPVTGYLTVPTDVSKKYPVLVQFEGYGVTRPYAPKCPPSGRISFYVTSHGFEFGREPEYYQEFWKSIMSANHTFAMDPQENSDPERAYFSGMTYRIMRALEYVKTRPEWNGKDLAVTGSSMGGLQTVWAAALDPAVTHAMPRVPWCCDMGGTELKRNRGGWYVKWVKPLGYFDPVNLAKRIGKDCTVDIQFAGLGDYVCPPSGLAVLYNNLRCPKSIRFIQGGGHDVMPRWKPVQEFTLSEK